MFLLLRLAAAMALGAAAGWFLRPAAGGPQIGAAMGAAGQAAFAALAWLGRPSEQTSELQSRIETPWVVAVLLLAFASVTLLLQFPATVAVPAASYLLVRILLSLQMQRSGSISLWSLWMAARGAEILTLVAAIIKV